MTSAKRCDRPPEIYRGYRGSAVEAVDAKSFLAGDEPVFVAQPPFGNVRRDHGPG